MRPKRGAVSFKAMDSYVIDAARTPKGRGKAGKGALTRLHPQEILAQVLRALVKRTGFEAGAVDDVIVERV